MKLPKTFVPNKDLEKKTEELVEGYREVTLEELMKNNMQIIHGDATNTQRIENIENITSKIIDDTLKNWIKWEEGTIPNPDFSKCYKSKAVIPDYKKEHIIVQVLFLISESKNLGKYGYLYLGNYKGLCLNPFTDYQKIEHLALEYFK